LSGGIGGESFSKWTEPAIPPLFFISGQKKKYDKISLTLSEVCEIATPITGNPTNQIQ
jgi:hypothetical protein